MKKLYILLLLCSFIGFSQSPGDLVITEIMNNPSPLSDTTGEWFEIYNTTGSAIDIDGWTLKDDGSNTHTIDAASGGTTIIPAGGYLVLGRTADTNSNGGAPVNYAYGTSGFTLGNGADEVVLETPGAVEISRVNYDGGPNFPDPTGASMQLDSGSLNETANDVGANWCESTITYGDGTGSLGTPGSANSACGPTCSATLGSSDTTCDSINPGATDDTYTVTLDYFGAATGETFVVSTSPSGFTITGDDPTSVADGTITISGVTEGTDITISVSNTGDGGVCDLTRAITSPTCVPVGTVDLEFRGVADFTTPTGGNSGKMVHLMATADIADISIYAIGSANNGGGTDGAEFTLPVMSVSNGDHILIARELTSIESYFTTPGYNLFDVHIEDTAGSAVSQNGDDAIELFKNGVVVETFGDINVDGTGESWEYLDSWAYKDTPGATFPTGWIYGGVGCTNDGSTTTLTSGCVYPFLASLSTGSFNTDKISIYPNPVTDGVININSTLLGSKQIALYDITGRQVLYTNTSNNTINVTNLKSGVYLLNITAENKAVTKKIIIE